MAGHIHLAEDSERMAVRNDWRSIQSLIPVVMTALVLTSAFLVYLAYQQDMDRHVRSSAMLERVLDLEFDVLATTADDLRTSYIRDGLESDASIFVDRYVETYQNLELPFDILLLWDKNGDLALGRNVSDTSDDPEDLANHPTLDRMRARLFEISAVGQSGLEHSQRYLAYNGRPYLMQMFSMPDLAGLPVPGATAPGGALLRAMQPSRLQEFSEATSLDDLGLLHLDGTDLPASSLTLARYPGDTPEYALTWESHDMTKRLLPILGVVILVIWLFCMAAWQQINRASSRIRNTTDALVDFADTASDVLWETDDQGRFTFISHDPNSMPNNALAMLGQPIGKSGARLSMVEGNFRRQRQIARKQDFRNLEVRFPASSGKELILQVSGKPIMKQDRLTGWRGTAKDVTAEREIQREIRFHAEHDSLTRLANRNLFGRLAKSALTGGGGQHTRTMIALIDLDGFKSINDSLGHQMGDRVLVATAGRMEAWVKGRGHAARLGGDEFAVILDQVEDRQDGLDQLEHLHQILSEPILTAGISVFVRMSVGMVVSPDDGTSLEELLKNADFALYHAKGIAGAKVQPFSKHFGESLKRRRDIEAAIEEGLAQDEFSLLYQPQIRLRDGRAEAVEALLRWEHPTMGTIEPSEFIPIAEETGLIIPLSQWVLERACEDAAHWQRMGIDLKLAINLSPVQVIHQDVVSEVHNVLNTTNLAPENLILEITEGVLMTDVDRARNIFKEMTRLGIDIAVDDFGTGYSSLTYLAEFPITKIKLDKRFLFNVPEDLDACIIVAAVLKLGRDLDIDVVVEGVENEEQIEWLKSIASPILQGFALARPLRLEDIHTQYGLAAE